MVIKKYAVMMSLLLAAHGVFAQDSTSNPTTDTTTQPMGSDTTTRPMSTPSSTTPSTTGSMGSSSSTSSSGSMSSGTLNDAKSYWDDSSKVSTKNMAQYNEFRNNQYPYPAKPRDMWQLGLTGGVLVPLFDVPNAQFPGWHAGLNLRKSLGYMVSVKFGAEYGEAKGYEYRPGVSTRNLPTNNLQSAYSVNGWIPNYKMQAVIPSVELMFSFANILFHHGNPKSNVYFTAGYTPFVYHTKIDALNGNAPYNFSGSFTGGSGINFGQKRTDVQKAIKNLLDGSYETDALVRSRSQNFDDASSSKWQFRHSAFVGGGYEFKLGTFGSLGLEAKYYIISDDYLDGVTYGTSGTLTPANDNLISGDVTFGINLGSKTKRTEPLWFQNPLNFAYNELNAPQHMKIPTPVLPDADGDGVTDQFDQEPSTPAGAPVDSHGVAKDTDGDGVPDYKDKELLTPQKCFPVDADGIGKCPPTCCDSIAAGLIKLQGKCDLGSLPSIEFKGNAATLSKAAQASLASIAQQLQNSPDCKVRVTGHGASDKRAQQRSWDRVNAVIQYMVNQQGISESRFIFIYGTDGDANVVDIEGTTDEGPNNAPAPHPQYQK